MVPPEKEVGNTDDKAYDSGYRDLHHCLELKYVHEIKGRAVLPGSFPPFPCMQYIGLLIGTKKVLSP